MSDRRNMPFAIPTPQMVQDPYARAVLQAIIFNLQVFSGISGDRSAWMLTRKDLTDASIVKHDELGRLAPAFTLPQPTPTSSLSSVGTSTEALLNEMRAGVVDITSGAKTGSVTGLALTGVPSPAAIFMQLVKPTAGGYNIGITVVEDSITVDGWDFELTGSTNVAGFKAAYLLMPEG